MTVILAMALFLLAPGMSVPVGALAKLAPVTPAAFEYTAPAQDKDAFDTESTTYNLSDWSKPSSNNLVTQQITDSTSNSNFNKAHDKNSLTSIPEGRQPFVIATDTLNMSAKGGYTSTDITLRANSYYKISVDYCVVEQKDNKTEKDSFGTFYLNNNTIRLPFKNNTWDTAAFYVSTDLLETTTITVKLYFGSETETAIGAIYFDKFNVTAIKQSTFEADTAVNDAMRAVIDFANHDAYHPQVQAFNNDEFTASETTANAGSYNSVSVSNLPNELGFSEQHYFNAKDDMTTEVMLLKANDANASLTLKDYTFTPRPHEVYMFQFYSIAAATVDFSFYFMIGNTAQEIANVTDYPYHNGWQLNTVFFVAGRELEQEYELSFTLNPTSDTTGWACIDDFKIYKVSGSYAVNNAKATGVHGTYDQNATTDSDTDTASATVTNGYFELGTASDNVNSSTYPYPLVADSWTSNVNTNGIVNLHPTLWNPSIEHPGYPTTAENNQVYMMHNSSSTLNYVTSPALNTILGETTYVSFDAYGQTASDVRAYILTAETDDDGNFTNVVVLGNILPINDNGWHHYEFKIIDSEFATSRNYYLRFEMTGKGYAFFDYVRLTSEDDDTFSHPQGTTTADVDLDKQFILGRLWKATDELARYNCEPSDDGIFFNTDTGVTTVVQYSFAYNLVADDYYEFVIEARGKNAYLGLSNYDGLLAVTTDSTDANKVHTYKLYLQPTSSATSVNIQITLGYVAEDDDDEDEDGAHNLNGEIFISGIKVNGITEDAFDIAKKKAGDDDTIKILSESTADDSNDTDVPSSNGDNNFFGENWWYLVPSLITATALLLAMGTFLFRKIKFDKHITKKTTSYARDMQLKNQQNKIVAQKTAKVDNVIDEPQNN